MVYSYCFETDNWQIKQNRQQQNHKFSFNSVSMSSKTKKGVRRQTNYKVCQNIVSNCSTSSQHNTGRVLLIYETAHQSF